MPRAHRRVQSTSGTHRVGRTSASYADLTKAFGAPTIRATPDDQGESVSAEWHITFPDGTFATVYDYKTSPLYDQDDVTASQLSAYLRRNRDWSIGGRDARSARAVKEALGSRNGSRGRNGGNRPTVKSARAQLRRAIRRDC